MRSMTASGPRTPMDQRCSKAFDSNSCFHDSRNIDRRQTAGETSGHHPKHCHHQDSKAGHDLPRLHERTDLPRGRRKHKNTDFGARTRIQAGEKKVLKPISSIRLSCQPVRALPPPSSPLIVASGRNLVTQHATNFLFQRDANALITGTCIVQDGGWPGSTASMIQPQRQRRSDCGKSWLPPAGSQSHQHVR
ncbi:hypothetical protein BDW75DRAFT_160571 [Aspergillus navahoensis]